MTGVDVWVLRLSASPLPPTQRRSATSAELRRAAVAAAAGAPPESVRLSTSAGGGPTVVTPVGFGCSSSHSGRWVAVAVGRGPVGVDVEEVRAVRWLPELIELHLTERERFDVRGAEDPHQAFLRLWTRKEACLKACGLGLRVPLRCIDVLNDIAVVDRQAVGSPELGGPWRLATSARRPEVVASVATQDGRGTSLRWHDDPPGGFEDVTGDTDGPA